MNAPVLLYGNRAADSVPLAAMALDVSPQETLVLPDVQILYVLHEMPMQTALARLPVALHPSIPAVLGITFMHAKDSPFGEFTLAYVGIACRTGIKPRHFITGAFCGNADAAKYFGGRYGFDCRHAVVSYHETYDRIRGEVQVDGRSILDVAIAECIPLVGAGGMIKYSPPLTATRVGGEPALVQFEAGYDFKRSIRGRSQLATFDAAALGDAALTPTMGIAGSHAVVDLHLMPARFQVDLTTPVEAGGAKKIAR
ncbi:MAG: hypothetical protein IPG43_19145 [Proteobacteria bacterium]|nr:hypothetical protein [Pseudomonadota bacterium]